jgi:hypothetical protein
MPAGEDIDFALGSGGDTIKFLSNTGGSGQVRLSPRGWNNAAAATTQLNFNTSRGTVSSALPNNSGDILTQIAFSGGTGTGTTAYYNGATIKVAATENYSSTAGGTNISFWTTPNTTHVIQNSVQIENTGVLTAYYGIYSYGTFTLNAGTRTSGTAAYFYVSAAADTGITANTESIGANWVTATRTWADGTVAIQREHLIAAPTYNKTTTAATFTKAATFAITAAPIAGTGVTITNPYALWVQAGLTQLDGGVNVTGTIVASSTLKTAAGVTWDFGALTTATVSLDTTRYLAVTVGGVAYKVLVAP